MSSLLRYALLLVLGYLGILAWLWHQAEIERQLESAQIAALATEKQLTLAQADHQNGYVTSRLDNERFHSASLDAAIAHIPNHQAGGNFVWEDRAGNAFAYAAMGVDKNHYFANSYLLGFEPYKTRKLWQPLVTLALKKSYQFDHEQHGANWKDVWQNSQQAYFYSHGDCEDHAILLADWLISMGYDARVAIGRIPTGGHAWVILFYDGKEYLLESTSKRPQRSVSNYTLARYAPDYQPEYMFNRERFWVNTGPKLTTRYSGQNWRLTADFVRGAIPSN